MDRESLEQRAEAAAVNWRRRMAQFLGIEESSINQQKVENYKHGMIEHWSKQRKPRSEGGG